MRLDTQTFQLKTTFHTSDTKQALAVLLIGDLAILFIPYLPLPSNLAVRELNTFSIADKFVCLDHALFSLSET